MLFVQSKHENLKHYQLLAIEPKTEKVLNYIQSGNFDCDLLTFPLESAMMGTIKKSNFGLPLLRGIGIEINYAGCISGTRQKSIALGQILVDKTKADNIVLSSGASGTALQRSTKDVIFMLVITYYLFSIFY